VNEALVMVIGAAALLGGLYVVADRYRTFAVCRIEHGRMRVVRGKLPARVRVELEEVVARSGLKGGGFSIKREDRRPQLFVDGIRDPNVVQRLRNVVGRFRSAEMR
jgi:hypothetical protein